MIGSLFVELFFFGIENALNKNINQSKFVGFVKLLSVILLSMGLVFLGIYGPYIHEFLSFASLSIIDWLYIVMSTIIFIIAFELMKILKRWRYKKFKDSTIS